MKAEENRPRAFTVTTLGCKVNQFESEEIIKALVRDGYTYVDNTLPREGERVDACIVNTCTVTHKASMQSRQAVRQAGRRHPGALIVVIGCYAQTEPEALQKIDGVDRIVGHHEKQHVPAIVAGLLKQREGLPELPVSTGTPLERPGAPPPRPFTGRTRPFLKIQDGCEAFCTYCIVPYARGSSRSMPPEEVSKALQGLMQAGYHEVVLTGIHLGRYGQDLDPPTSLQELLQDIRAKKSIERLRLSSIEPLELPTGIIQMAAETKGIPVELCRHFHLPLQSGDDAILKKMNRPYGSDAFQHRVFAIRQALPDAGIGTDVLIGFPGESDDAFENTCALIRELPLTYLHVFPYSPRKGTPAARFSGRVPATVIKKRCRIVRDLGMQKKDRFLEAQVGKAARVLVENSRDRRTGLLKGLTGNYCTVLMEGDDSLKNTFQEVRLEKRVGGQALYGNRNG